MDSSFNWLGVTQPPSDASGSLSHPPVSFGANVAQNARKDSAQGPPKDHHPDHRYTYRNPSTDSIASQPTTGDSVPLSLQAHELSLEESKTYMRWYSDILARTNSRTVSIDDVYQFLSNFKISADVREKINRVFSKILHSINIGEFFALLRVVSHALQGKEPSRGLIAVNTTVPIPPSILSKKRHNGESEDEIEDEEYNTAPTSAPAAPLDLDSFTQFMLTGERPGEKVPKRKSRKLKSVKFSDEVVTGVQDSYTTDSPAPGGIDYSLPMDQLLSRMSNGSNHLAPPQTNNRLTSPDPEEKEILRDMEPQINHFRNLHSVDTISVDGVPANIHVQNNSDFSTPRTSSPQPPLLKPNMTGPAQMAQMGFSNPEPNQPLRPNVTGPEDMARYFAPTENEAPGISLQAFTSQMTADTYENTQQNQQIGTQAEYHRPAPPTPATRRARSVSQPNPIPISWESANNQPQSQGLLHPGSQAPPIPSRSPIDPASKAKSPPPPPPPRSRKAGMSPSPVGQSQVPPPLPAKVPHSQVYSNSSENSSTANILDDLKALQEEVDKIRDMTGGF